MRETWCLSCAVNIVEWDINSSVYNAVTGQTHVFNALPIEIIKSLKNSPLSSYNLALKISDLSDELYSKDWQLYIDSILLKLEEIDLIELSG